VVTTSNMRKAAIDNGSEMTDKELNEFAEKMYSTMVAKIEASRSNDAAAEADEP
jgi:hypothetical protein